MKENGYRSKPGRHRRRDDPDSTPPEDSPVVAGLARERPGAGNHRFRGRGGYNDASYTDYFDYEDYEDYTDGYTDYDDYVDLYDED